MGKGHEQEILKVRSTNIQQTHKKLSLTSYQGNANLKISH